MPDNPISDTSAAILKDYLRGDAELARALGKSDRTIARWRALGEGPTITRIGREILYHVDDVKNWLDSQRVDHAA